MTMRRLLTLSFLLVVSCATTPEGGGFDEELAWEMAVQATVGRMGCPTPDLLVEPMALRDSDTRAGAARRFKMTGCGGAADVLVFGPCESEQTCHVRVAPATPAGPVHENEGADDVKLPWE